MSENESENEESGSGSGEESGEVADKDAKEKNTNQKQEPPKSEPKKEIQKILFNQEKVTQYWKDQKPPKKGLFIDQSFPPIAESLYDKKMKNEGVEKMNIYQIDWRKSTELFKKKDLTLFPNEYHEYHNLKKHDIINVYGKVEKRFDNYQLIVSKIIVLKE